jgi:predicted nucleotidyltransferase
MTRRDLIKWDLNEIIDYLKSTIEGIETIYLFGSRAHNGSSHRSDIDILVLSSQAIPIADVLENLHEKYPPVDLFETNDNRTARSLINGSSITSNTGTLAEMLGAIQLWPAANNDTEEVFDSWIQTTVRGIDYKMTILPIPQNIEAVASRYLEALNFNKLSGVHMGSSWLEISKSIANYVENAVNLIKKLRVRGTNWKPSSLSIQNEYDFQSLINLVLGAWQPELESEPFEIKFADSKKNADFSLMGNMLVIEAKHSNSASKQSEIVKTLDGLTAFYTENPRVQALLYLVLYETTLNIDVSKLESRYSFRASDHVVVTKFIPNKSV